MKLHFSRIVGFALIIVLLVSSACFGGGGGGVVKGGATEMTQLANKAQLVEQVRQAVQQTQQLISQYQNMLQNTLQLPQNIWNDITGELSGLQNLLSSAQSLSFGAVLDHEKFTLVHPGYRDSGSTQNYAQLYKDRMGAWQKYWEAAMKANNMSVESIKNSQSLIKLLNDAAKSSEGQHQALQAANQISIYMAQQLSELRMDMQRQIDTQAKYALNEQQERADEQAAYETAIGTWQKQTAPKKY